jgi:hypothetical protein
MIKKTLIILTTILLISGCVAQNANLDSTKISVNETPAKSIVIPNNSLQPLTDKLNNLEEENKVLKNEIDNLQERIDRVDLLKPSTKQLIPQVPFKIEVYWGEMQSPQTYTFKNDIDVIIGDGYGNYDYATYTLFRNNNTIKINSKKYQFYGLSLYDDYIASTYKNGWIGWVTNYRVIPPKYNSITQKYELN